MGQTTKQYISAITSMDKRDILGSIIDVENLYGFNDTMNAFGRMKPAKVYKVEHHVNEPLWREGVVAVGGVTNNNTPTVTVVLTTATSANRRKNEIVMTAAGKVGYVHNVTYAGNDATLVIKSNDGTNLAIAAGEKIKFYGTTVGEKSVDMESIFIGAQRYFQLLQIFRDSHSETDVAKLSEVEATAKGGGKVYSYYEYVQKWLKVKAVADANHFIGQIGASEFSSTVNPLADPTGGGTMQFERGLYQYISSLGVLDDITTAGSPTLTGDIATMIQLLIAKKAGNKYNLFGATEPIGKIDDHLKNLPSGSVGVSSARMNMDGKTLNFEVEKINYRGFTLQKYLMPILNQPDLFGNTLFDNGIFWQPEGRVSVVGADGDNSYEPRIQIRYKPLPMNKRNKGNAIWGEFHGGMFSDEHSEGMTAESRVTWISAQCIEVLGAQHFGYMGRVAR